MPTKSRRRGSGEGAIYQRESDGRWVAVVDAGYINGKRRRFTAYAKRRKDAAERLPELKRRAKLAGQQTTSIKTVAEFLTHWMDTSVRKNRAPTTIESYQGAIVNHIVPVIGSRRLAALERMDIQRMLDAVAAKDGVGPRSVENVSAVMRKALNDAVKWSLLETNPAQHTEIAKVPQADRKALTVEQARQLLFHVADDRFEALYALAAIYGLRRGECLGLRWSDIDHEAREIHIRQQVVVVNNAPLVTPVKTKKSSRNLPLLKDIDAALDRRRERQAEERLAAGEHWIEHDLVFASMVGTPYQPANHHKRWHASLKRAGLPDVPFHSLRHTAASFLVALNVHPRIAMEILGHANIKTTMEVYSHVQQPGMRDALESVENVLRHTVSSTA
ncbi:MAG: site-specific integrase [Chloroflexia bacterium]|nr:site-specific integrase [Chloroflexia bacterium]